MEEIDLDELLQGLESIVSSFGDDILDFSLKLFAINASNASNQHDTF